MNYKMSENNYCDNWKRVTSQEGGDNLRENFYNEEGNDIKNVEVNVLTNDPFAPPVSDTDEYSKFFVSSLLNGEDRKCAGVLPLDSSLAPYVVDIPKCNHYSCEAQNVPFEHKKDGCGNI